MSKWKYEDPFQQVFHNWYAGQRAYKHIRPLTMTYEEFLRIWEESGHLAERGTGLNQYCMSIFDVTQPYSEHNVEIITNAERLLKQGKRTGKKVMDDKGNEYYSKYEAARMNNISPGHVTRRIKKGTWKII